ncbi:BspA family leucine-rich repeat surface protein [Slackia isoflavoniconvertens]|uniref:BspA family leucine-rich repeat surface protein n=1 Tax=Slackia isoflavoniconvertens TaxID=572010 RepID=UPI003AB334AB
MQRKKVVKGNAALRCALSLTLAVGMAPTLAYADSLDAQDAASQPSVSFADNSTNSEAVALASFRSFGEGCEWALDASGALTVRAADSESATLPSGTWPWADVIDQITSVVFEPGVKAGLSLNDLFNDAVNLTSADLSGLDASDATTMDRMFKGCSSLVDVNLKRFDSSNVTSMSELFFGCSSLEKVDLSSIDNLSVTDPYSGLSDMFKGCTKLSSITLGQRFSHGGGQENSHIIIFPNLPADQGFTNLWRSSWNNRLYTRSNTGKGYEGIPDRIAATYTAEKLDDGWRLFRADYDKDPAVSNCMWKVDNGTLRIKPYKESDDPDLGFYLRSWPRPWEAYNDQITAISIEGECNFKGSINSAFGGMPALKTADLSGLSLLQIQDMGFLFSGCPQLESVTFNSNCKSSVRSYESMFRDCTSLKSVDMSGVDCHGWAVESLKHMFDGCTSLEKVDVSGMAAGQFTEMEGMFNGCTALRSIAVGSTFTFQGEDHSSKILPDLGAGYTGKWVSSVDGNAYAQNEIPGFVAATYTPQRGTTDISGARIMGWKSLYTDDETIPTSVDVIVGNALLVQGGDYTLERVHDFNACPGEPTLGKWEYVIRGKGNYTGEIRRTLYVKRVVDAPTVTQGLVYNGREQSCLDSSSLPSMVKLSNTTGIKPGNYTAYAYFDGEDADFYMWDDGWSAELQLFWTIGKADAETALTVAGYEDKYAWTGSRIEPKVQVRVPWQDNPLVEGQDYEVYYDNNIDVGTATISVWPNWNFFDGAKTVEFEIVEGVVPEPEPVVSGTWKGSAGKWWYQYSDGSYLKSCWKDIDGARYYFDESGYAKAGWAVIDDSWYWFDPSSSAMKTGWQSIGGTWYWFADSGVMATGWQQVDGSWYLFSGSGAMLTGWQFASGTWYYLGGSGVMHTGWQSIDGAWYWFSGSGAMATGWQQIDGVYYYFNGSGAMQRDCWVGDYYLTGSGAMATNQWIGSYHVGADGRWDNR